jgi:exopolysaccharide production protein ExoZ
MENSAPHISTVTVQVGHELSTSNRSSAVAWTGSVLARLGARMVDWCYRAFELPSGGRIRPMEGLRGLSVMLVFFVHYDALYSNLVPQSTLTYEISHFVGALGNAGVDMFFLISGYLIYGAVLRHTASVGQFLRRRIQRIYPTFLFVLGIYVVATNTSLGHKMNWASPGYAGYLVANILLLPGLFPIDPIISVAWSLSYELLFYVTMPLLVAGLWMRDWLPRWRVAFFCGFAFAYALLSLEGLIAHVRVLMFVTGLLLYELIDAQLVDGKLSKKGETFIAAACLAGLLAVGWITLRIGQLPANSDVIARLALARLLIESFSFAAIALYSFCYEGFLRRMFCLTPIRWLGNISYSYYLVHGGALDVFRKIGQWLWHPGTSASIQFWVLLPCGVAVTVTVSVAVFLLVEKPLSFATRPASRNVQKQPIEQGLSA